MFHNMPVVRNPWTGRPVANAVRPINRSEVIRRIFRAKGKNVSNNVIHDHLLRQGLTVHDSTINKQREKLLEEGIIAPLAAA